MHALPPEATVAATTKDGEGMTLFDHDEGEEVGCSVRGTDRRYLAREGRELPVLKIV